MVIWPKSITYRATLTHPTPAPVTDAHLRVYVVLKNKFRSTKILFSKLRCIAALKGGGGVQAFHFGKNDFELGVGGNDQDTSRHFEGSFRSIRAILPM